MGDLAKSLQAMADAIAEPETKIADPPAPAPTLPAE